MSTPTSSAVQASSDLRQLFRWAMILWGLADAARERGLMHIADAAATRAEVCEQRLAALGFPVDGYWNPN